MESAPSPARQDRHHVEWIIWCALAVTFVAITGAFVWTRFFAERLEKPLFTGERVPAFALTNQFGQPFSMSNLLGHVIVADVIFTRCPISCEAMSRRMRALQDQLRQRANVRFVSLTADPGFDTPEILHKYAERHGADPARWFFLTGTKQDVFRLAIDGLKLTVVEKTEQKEYPEDLFVHSTLFILIDKQGRIRGSFEGTDDHDRKQLAIAAKMLEKEK